MGTMNRWGRVSRRGVLVLGALLAVVGCLSPTLPLPPPSRPDVTSPDSAGFVRLSGVVQRESTVFALNQRVGRIVGQTTDETGEYELELSAEVGDRLVLWYRNGADESPTTEVIVPDANSGPGPGGAEGSD